MQLTYLRHGVVDWSGKDEQDLCLGASHGTNNQGVRGTEPHALGIDELGILLGGGEVLHAVHSGPAASSEAGDRARGEVQLHSSGRCEDGLPIERRGLVLGYFKMDDGSCTGENLNHGTSDERWRT